MFATRLLSAARRRKLTRWVLPSLPSQIMASASARGVPTHWSAQTCALLISPSPSQGNCRSTAFQSKPRRPAAQSGRFGAYGRPAFRIVSNAMPSSVAHPPAPPAREPTNLIGAKARVEHRAAEWRPAPCARRTRDTTSRPERVHERSNS